MPVTNLPFLQQQITRYGLSIYFALGLIGNIFNCIMFTRQSYRHTSSSVYFLTLSIFSIIYIIWTMFPLMHTLNYSDPQTQSVVYCKAQKYGIHILAVYLRYTIVFACIDRFFLTRTNARLRSLSSVKIAVILLIIMIIIGSLIAVHILIYMDIRNGICGMTGIYRLIYAIYQIVIVSIVPPLLMGIFSILTIHSLHQRHSAAQLRIKQRDQHMIRMVIAEVLINIITSIPYSASLFYGAFTYTLTNKSAERIEIESFITYITQLLVYSLSVIPFYLFIFTSKPFRKDFIGLLMNFWNKFIRRRAQIFPFSEQSYPMTTVAKTAHSK
ncbi:hypothetical protein I4U23_003996 [Adineta vaga]|nr:hypothetical protein I4U23_003996 [Adineta vaga]